VDDLIASVGYGKITPLQIVGRIIPKPKSEIEEESLLNKILGKVRKKKPGSGVVVRGVDDILIKFGKCCQPVPGDSITGYITQGFGVTVHRTSCVNALKMNPERQIEVEWNKDIAETYSVKIQITSYDRVGLLADITSVISRNEANILGVNTKTLDNKTVDGCFTISVKDTAQLKKVISDLKKIKLVHRVRRLDG